MNFLHSLKKNSPAFFIGVFFVLIFSFIIPVVPMIGRNVVHANGFSGGSGTSYDPYLITTCSDLSQINTNSRFLQDYFVLGNSMNCSSSGSNIMVGSESTPFTGVFDGQGYTVTVNIHGTGGNPTGLFSDADDATISNLTIAGFVTGNISVGGLVGISDSGGDTLTNDRVTANVSGDREVGGLIGELDNYDSEVSSISNSSTTGTVTARGAEAGGLVGFVDDEGISVIGDTTSVSITDSSHSGGLVSGGNCTGGLVGNFYADYTASASVTGSSNTSDVTDTEGGDVGGLFGQLLMGQEDDAVTGTFENNTYSGTVTGSGNEAGGFAGYLDIDSLAYTTATDITISNNTTSGTVTGTDYVSGFIGYSQLYGESGGNFGTTLTVDGNNSSATVTGTGYSVGGLIGEIDSYDYVDQPMTVSFDQNYGTGTVSGQSDVGGLVGSYYSEDDSDSGTELTGNFSEGFFIGPSVTVTGDSFPSAEGGGLFGEVEGPSANPFIISDSYANTAVSGYSAIGGLVGASNDGLALDRVYAAGSVTGNNVDTSSEGGGLMGLAHNSTINDSFSTSNVSGFVADEGALIGDGSSAALADSYYDQTATGQTDCNGSDVQGGCTPVNTDGSQSDYFIDNSTNPPLDTWDFASTPIWDAYPGAYPTLHAIAADDPLSAVYTSGDGSSGNPYQISSCLQFEDMSQNSSDSYVLENNLDCTTSGNSIMVGSDDVPFSGNFEGNNYTVTVAIDDSAGNFDNVGLFKNINGASINDLNIAGTVEAQNETGALAGEATNSSLDSDSSSATITIDDNDGAEPDVGGLVGYLNNSIITNSYATGTIDSDGSVTGLGGLVGMADNDSSLETSYSNGNIVMTNDDIAECGVGGFAGCIVDGSEAEQDYATGNVATPAVGGGFTGSVVFAYVEDSYATGTVSGSYGLAGFAAFLGPSYIARVYASGAVQGDGTGDYGGGLTGEDGGATITDSFATGLVSNFQADEAGLIGYDNGGNTYADDYYDQAGTGQDGCTSTGDVDGCTGIDAPGSHDGTYFEGNSTNPPLSAWDFTTPVWDATAGFLPTLDAISSDHETAVFSSGDGSSGNPFQINTCSDFENINTNLSANYVLEESLDCTGDGNSVMVGSQMDSFTGTFDGGGHTITVAIDDPGNPDYEDGLFHNINGALIQNLHIAGSVEALYDTGALVGDAFNSEIDNVSSSATITIDDSGGWDPDVGGLVGYASSSVMLDDVDTGNLSSSDSVDTLGGLVGNMNPSSTITTSYATGNVDVAGSSVICGIGGLVGCEESSSDISQSYATGSVTGFAVAGGLVGAIESSATVEDSYATGDVSGDNNLGGFVGSIGNSEMDQVYASGTVTGDAEGDSGGGLAGSAYGDTLNNSFAVGAVSGFTDDYAGLIGQDEGAETFSNDFYDQITTGQTGCTQNGDTSSCTAVDTSGSPNATYFFGNSSNPPLNAWDFTTPIWDTVTDGLPVLDAIPADHGIPSGGSFSGGDGSSGNPYQITTCSQFENINNDLSSDFILENDLDCSGDGNAVMVATEAPFTGTFDGQGNTITVDIDDSTGSFDEVGLFQETNGATVSNLNVAGSVEAQNDTGALVGDAVSSIFDSDSSSATITIDDNTAYPQIGGLAGDVDNTTISNSFTSGTIVSNGGVGGLGGLVGFASDYSELLDDYSTADVTMNTSNINYGIGGLVGFLYSSADLSQGYATGAVSSPDNAGGLIGFIYYATAENSYATGDVSGGNTLGGFVGTSLGGTIEDSYASGTVTSDGGGNGGGFIGNASSGFTVENSFSSGDVSGFASGAGGFSGTDDETNTYTNDFYDQVASGQDTCLGGGEIDGCTAVDTSGSPDANYFLANDTNAPLNDWDFSTPVWDEINNGLPVLDPIFADHGTPPSGPEFSNGDGSSGNPYQIDTCSDFEDIENYPSSDFVLENDLDCSGEGENIMVGASTPFAGTFDGQGHTITIDVDDGGSLRDMGLFFRTNGATIDDLNVAGTMEGQAQMGALVGDAENSAFDSDTSSVTMTLDGNTNDPDVGDLFGFVNNSTISNSYATGDVVSNGELDGLGGMIGQLTGGSELSTSYATGNVTDTNDSIDEGVGGLVGYLNGGDISQSYAIGTVTSPGYGGGLTGGLYGGTVENSYATGPVNGGDYMGGIAGWIEGATLSQVYASGAVTADGTGSGGGGFSGYSDTSTFNNSFATGAVSGFTSDIGGFIGEDNSGNTYNNNFYDQVSTGQSGCVQGNDVSGCMAVDTSGSPNASYFLGNSTNAPLNDWDFTTPVWDAVSGYLPTLDAITANHVTSSTQGDIKVTVTDVAGTPIVGAAVNIACPSNDGFVELGTTDSDGIIEVNPTTAASGCSDGSWVSLQSTATGYLDDENDSVSQYRTDADPENEEDDSTTNQFSLKMIPVFNGTGSGTSDDPYVISDCMQLEGIDGNLSADYKIVPSSGDTIDCSGIDFQPIGIGTENGFTGILNGNDSTIENLTISQPDTNFVGMFSEVSGNASIEDLTLASGSVTGEYEVGSLVGDLEDGATVNHVSSALDVMGTDDYDEGGIVGYADVSDNTSNQFSNLTYTGSMDIPEGDIGGIFGELDINGSDTSVTLNDDTVSDGTIGNSSGSSYQVGGLIGYVSDDTSSDGSLAGITISNSTVSSAVSTAGGGDDTGGLVGQINSDSENGLGTVSFDNDSVTGPVSGNYSVGGLIGESDLYDEGGSVDYTINDSSVTQNVTGTSNEVGGLIGHAFLFNNDAITTQMTIKNSFTTGNVTGDSVVGGLIGGTDGEGPGITITGADSLGGLTMENDYATGNITGNVNSDNAFDTGGLVGYLYCGSENPADPYGCSVASSYATGTVSGYQNVGGLIGDAEGDEDIHDVYAQGTVMANQEAGGLIGYANQDQTIMSVDRTYASGAIVISGDSPQNVGGLVGQFDTNGGATFADSFSVADMSDVPDTTNLGWIVGQVGSVVPRNMWYSPVNDSSDNNCAGDTGDNSFCTNEGSGTFFQNSTVNGPLGNWDFTTPIWIDHADDYPTLSGNVYVPPVPTISITAPADTSTITTWSPVVDWGNATTCDYSYGGNDATNAVNCRDNGSDIPPPDAAGATTLNIQASNETGSSSVVSATFTYDPDLQSETADAAAYWKFDETTQGATVADSSGNGNDGTVSGSPTPSSDHPDLVNITPDTESLGFNSGTSDEVVVPDASTLNASGSFSIAFWMKPDAWNNSSSEGIISKWDTDANLGYVVYDDGSGSCGGACSPLLNFRAHGTNNDEDYLHSTASVDVGVWQHWAIVYDATLHTVRIYKNGSLDTTYTSINIGDMTNSSDVYLGYSQPWMGYFDGSLDDLRIYQKAITPADVAYLAATVSEPVISSVSAAPAQTSAAITWTTDEDASSSVAYGTSESYGSSATGNSSVTSHSVSITGLACGTTYDYQVTSVDGGSHSNSSSNDVFTTSACTGAGGGGGSSSISGGRSATPASSTPTAGTQPVPAEPVGTTPSPSGIVLVFTRNLKKGSGGTDVAMLQHFLNTHGATVSPNGPGSLGHETKTYSTATVNALKKYQKAHGLVADGVFGSNTRSFVNAVLAGSNPMPNLFLKNLSEGETDPDVLRLEHYLNTHGFTVATSGPGSLGHETDTFGTKTFAALQLLQKSAGISANGIFGSQTRNWVNMH